MVDEVDGWETGWDEGDGLGRLGWVGNRVGWVGDDLGCGGVGRRRGGEEVCGRDGRLLGMRGGTGEARGGVLGDEATVWWVLGTE